MPWKSWKSPGFFIFFIFYFFLIWKNPWNWFRFPNFPGNFLQFLEILEFHCNCRAYVCIKLWFCSLYTSLYIYCSSVSIDILPVQLCLCIYSFYDSIMVTCMYILQTFFLLFILHSLLGVQKIIFVSSLFSVLWNYPWSNSNFPWKVLEKSWNFFMEIVWPPCHYIIYGLNWTIEPVVVLNVTWLGFVFVLILYIHMHSDSAVVVP